MEPPPKRQRKALLSDDSSDDESDNESGGLELGNRNEDFKINEEYARRFEHNKKREELQQLEGKLGKTSTFNNKQQSKQGAGDEEGSGESSSDSEDEDDEGILATEALDSEIFATLNAIRSKDPRVYDSNATFYASTGETTAQGSNTAKQSKPLYLRDYHREKLLNGGEPEDEDADAPPKTYAQEQDDLKRSVVKEMHAAADGEAEDDEDEEEGFLVKKPRQEAPSAPGRDITELDVESADKNPEKFLSNFLQARAWVPSKRSNLQPFESDDEEQDARADALEEAYNFRFEDPNKLNEALVTHSRDTTSKFSVRREELSGRKKKRELERQRKEEEKKQLEQERARLRKLKVEELEDKVSKIKHAAGIKADDITDEDWSRFLDEGWDDDKWEAEMQKRFGEEYYAEGEVDEDEADSSKKRRVKKPKWDDDIDIKDLVPDFEDEDDRNAGARESDGDEGPEAEGEEDEGSRPRKKDRLRDKREKQREARKQRQRIEQTVDKNLDVETAFLPGSSKKYSGHFRYRETSPVNFGLSARDILMAEDSQLNQYAGLKKLASFREADKKKRDRKRLGKKARLREWRKDTFGTEDGPPQDFPEPSHHHHQPTDAHQEANGGVDIREGGKKKRKRSKKH